MRSLGPLPLLILAEEDVNITYNKFINLFTNVFNTNCPVNISKLTQGKRKYKIPDKPWMTTGLKNACKKKNLLYKQFLKNRTIERETKYKKYKNKLTAILRYSAKQHYSNILELNKMNMKETWKILNTVINKKEKGSQYPTQFNDDERKVTSNIDIANGFNRFFSNIGPALARNIPNGTTNFTNYLNQKVEESIFLNPVTDEEIIEIVKDAKTKYSKDHDSIDMSLVKLVIPYIVKPLKHIFNISLQNGVFPDRMKIARVIPIFKTGDLQEFSNYRPISILPQFSKILEKIFHSRLTSFLNNKQILYEGQYGFRKKHSTSMAIFELVEEITTAMDNSMSTVAVFIDLKKAFDTVDHNILLNKLEHYGIRGLALSWIQSYLTNRTQYVSINDTNSTCINVTCGVPQGSILGPILFILYINDMHTVSSLMKCIIFADDTNFLYTGNDISEMCKTVSKELDKLSSWFMANKLSLNISKTNFMVISRKQIVNNPIVSINSINIERVYITKFLGVHIDCQLDWNGHIKSIKNKIAKNVSVMNRVKHLLNSHALYSLYTTLIIPYMNYCCEFWGNNYKSRIQPLYMLQKKAIRICKHEGYLSHTRPIFYFFNTLCIYDMIDYSSVVFMFKVYNNQFPRHLLCFFDRVYDSHNHNTRKNVNNFKIKYCRTSQKASCISVIGPKLWNNLHSDLQCSKSISRFKTHYKRTLLQRYEHLY